MSWNTKLKREMGAVTLPSVDSWGTNMNILRDPPKSITTRRVDKVGQTSFITELIDQSTDRACEGIRVYSRGVNPSVSVDYTGNQVGLAGGMIPKINSGAAKMPYKAMDNGAFRPPVRTERDLLPLSRLPRTRFGTNANPGLVNYAKTVYAPNDLRMVKDLIHGFDVKPNKSFQLERPIENNYRMEQAIQQPVNISADAGYNTLENYERTLPDMDMQRYIQENPIQYELSSGFQTEERRMGEMGEVHQTKNLPNYQYTSNISNPSVYKQIKAENEHILSRNLPQASASTQITRIARFDTNSEIDQRKYQNLPERSKRGGFLNEGVIPRFDRAQGIDQNKGDQVKSDMNKFVLSQQMNRYN